ncbi:MAG: hypothetical protein NDJ90_01905 [Oligoflexia bacterium]|nr:hypothetical protein [Oligoflexia bacterium]
MLKYAFWASFGIVLGILQGCEAPYSSRIVRESGEVQQTFFDDDTTIAEPQAPSTPTAPEPTSTPKASPTSTPEAPSLPELPSVPETPEQPEPTPSVTESPRPVVAVVGQILIKIDAIELLFRGGEKVEVLQRPGEIIDLMAVKRDVFKTLALDPVSDKAIREIRLITQVSGHQVLDRDGNDLCGPAVKVPGGIESGLKIHLPAPGYTADSNVHLELRVNTSLPVVFKGTGCNIHPSFRAQVAR